MMSKRALDLILGLLILGLCAPVLVVCAIAVWRSGPGPILFRQTRLGQGGAPFEMLKFRTMVEHAEDMEAGLFSYADDPRITRLGQVLRRTSLDELPQVFNVLAGQMSFVGPRPPVSYELGPWEDYTPTMRRRFDVKPGITGLAQVSGRNEMDWDAKVAFDNTYVDTFERVGVWIDLRILLRTLWVVCAGRDTVETPPQGAEGPIATRARMAEKGPQ